MPKTYVDNAMNRSLGRVGMTHGSMPVSRSGGSSSYGGGSSYGSGSYGGSNSYGGGGSTKVYVDNSMNRSLGRVGMSHGSMPVSRSGGGSNSYGGDGSTKTYVDNSMNRSLGRVGMPHGSMPVSRSGERSSHSCSSSHTENEKRSSHETKTYVDNKYNSRLGRVGLEHGTAVVSKKEQRNKDDFLNDSGLGASFCLSPASPAVKVYKDNPLNRRLNRVGLPHGTAIHSKNKSMSKNITGTPKTYVDNAFNRSVGRVGKPLGSMPISRRSKITSNASDIFRNLVMYPDHEMDFSRMKIDEEQQGEACDIALSLVNRMEEVLKWQHEQQTKKEPHTSVSVLKKYRGAKIDFDEIELMQKIGSGAFGDVHFAKWKGTVVAAKKLRVQRVSKRRLKEFTDEIFLLCELDHPNIVKFIGASVVTPNLCIVMEYMQMSLFDALHIKDDIEFSEKEKIKILQNTVLGLEYLHDSNIAHCDIKSCNILLDYNPDETLFAKITDFGLSMMKNETETSTSTGGDFVRNIGTPRYSSPENLRGEYLCLKDLKMADMYSYSLVVFEIVCEEEPFYNLNYPQLRKQVGELGLMPVIPGDILLESTILRLMQKCWDREPIQRPTAKKFAAYALQMDRIYVDQ